MLPHTRAIAICLLLGELVICGCVAALPRLPYGGEEMSQSLPGALIRPNPRLDSDDFIRSWADAQARCRSPFITARALVRGTLGRRSIDASFWFGVDSATNRLRLDSIDTGTARFGFLASHPLVFAGKDEGTLVAPGRRWVVRSRSRELIELVLGVPLSALDMRNVLTGCPVYNGSLIIDRFDPTTIKAVFGFGDRSPVEMFMRWQSAATQWEVFAVVGVVPERQTRWRADFGKRSRGVLESVRLTSLEWNGVAGRRFDLTFAFDRIQTPVTAPDTFNLPIPQLASELSVEAVRQNAPVPLMAN